MRLSAISKRIVLERLVDRYGDRERADAAEWLDGVIIDPDLVTDLNDLYNDLVNGYRCLIIA